MLKVFSEKLRRPGLMFLILSAFYIFEFKKTVCVFFSQSKRRSNYKKEKNDILMLIDAGLSKQKLQDSAGMTYW